MCNTSVISVRLPSDVLGEIDKMAASIGRSRNWYIHRCLLDRVNKGGDSSTVEYLPYKQIVAGSSPAHRSISLAKSFTVYQDGHIETGRPKHSATCKCGMCASLNL